MAVKGNAETSYRTGNVNLTPANIGALPLSGGTLSGQLKVGSQTYSVTIKDNVLTVAGGSNMYLVTPSSHFVAFSADAYSTYYAYIYRSSSRYGGLYLRDTTSGASQSLLANSTGTSVAVWMPTSGGTMQISSSDKRLKDNIKDTDIKNALDIINKIKFRQFDWKDSNEHQNIGFVADELEELDEHFVLKGTGGYVEDETTGEKQMNIKCVDTFYLLAYYGKAIQELYSMINEIQNRDK